jgi:antitoxin component of RelBE/YafQ-DinJ toxin-antitoxin module
VKDKGSINVAIDRALHKRAKLAAVKMGMPIRTWLALIIIRRLRVGK